MPKALTRNEGNSSPNKGHLALSFPPFVRRVKFPSSKISITRYYLVWCNGNQPGCNSTRIAQLFPPRDTRLREVTEKYWQRRRSYTRGYNQNANRFKNKRCKSIEIGCKGLNIAWRRGSLKSITEDYQGKVTPLAWGLRWRAAARSLNKTSGVGGSFCKYCYCHPAGNFASHMSSHRCPF